MVGVIFLIYISLLVLSDQCHYGAFVVPSSGYFCSGTGLLSPTGLCEGGFYCSGGAISPQPPRVSCSCAVNMTNMVSELNTVRSLYFFWLSSNSKLLCYLLC